MTEQGPIIDFDAEPTPEQKAEVLAQLRKALQPPPPVPRESLKILFEAAWGDTGGSQAARYFLFWLAGWEDPTCFKGYGGLELRRLDGRHRAAALDVLAWWAGPTKSDQPLYEILNSLNQKFGGPDESD
jgi:hypothetical protein